MNTRRLVSFAKGHRRLLVFIGVPIAIIILLAYTLAFLIDEPLRRYTEEKMNRALKGYTVHIFRHKVYEKVVGVASKILKNRTRKEVATRAEVKGRLDDPKVSPMQVVVHLIQNAFFKAILPGLRE